MARISLAPGFRFHPTDVELIMYFLKRKVMGKKLVCDAVTELDIYKFAPWDLPGKCPLKSEDLEWYFFCPRDRIYAVGARSNRATENGYWKITGIDKVVTFNYRTVGMRKTLIFYKGCPAKGERTDWVLHEYRLEDKNLVDVVQDAYVLCKIFQKGGLGPKNWAHYGALFKEEESGDMDEMFVDSQPVAHQISSKNIPPGDINVDAVSLSVPRPRDLLVNFVPELHPYRCLPQNTVMQPSMKDICVELSAVDPNILPDYVPPDTRGSPAAICMAATGNLSTWPTFKSGPFTDGSLAMDIPSDMDILSLLNMFTEDTDMPAVRNNSNEKKLEINGHLPLLGENGIYNDSGDLNDWIELADIESGISTKEAACDLNPVLIAENELFLELNDLITPLRCPPEAVQLDWLQTGSIYAVHTYDTSTGMDEFDSGVADLCPVEKVSGFGEYSALLEGPHLSGNNLKDLEKVGIVNFEACGSDAVRATTVPSAVPEPEVSNTAEVKPEKR